MLLNRSLDTILPTAKSLGMSGRKMDPRLQNTYELMEAEKKLGRKIDLIKTVGV